MPLEEKFFTSIFLALRGIYNVVLYEKAIKWHNSIFW